MKPKPPTPPEVGPQREPSLKERMFFPPDGGPGEGVDAYARRRASEEQLPRVPSPNEIRRTSERLLFECLEEVNNEVRGLERILVKNPVMTAQKRIRINEANPEAIIARDAAKIRREQETAQLQMRAATERRRVLDGATNLFIHGQQLSALDFILVMQEVDALEAETAMRLRSYWEDRERYLPEHRQMAQARMRAIHDLRDRLTQAQERR